MTSHEDQDFLDMVPDPHVKQILRKQINDVAFNDNRFEKILKQTRNTENQINLMQRPLGLNSQNNQLDDYQGQLNPYKRSHPVQLYQPQKYKRLSTTPSLTPIFKLTDLYLPSSSQIYQLIDQIFNNKILGQLPTSQLETQVDNTQVLQKIYNNWELKEDYDQIQNDRNQLTEKELQEVVVNLGDKKENYFLYIKSQKYKNPNQTNHQYQPNQTNQPSYLTHKRPIKNLPIANPNFLKHFKKSVSQLAHKNKQIQQFESEEDISQASQKGLFGSSKKVQNTTQSKLFGSMKFSVDKLKIANIETQSSPTYMNQSCPLVQQKIPLDINNKLQKSFNQSLIRYYSYSNTQISNNAHKGPLQNLNRIEYHLANPDFFLPKLHIALDRTNQQNKVKDGTFKQQGAFGKTNYNISQLNRSRISDSMLTGNKQLSRTNGQQMYPLLDDEQQTIQKRIQMQMRNIYKQPLHHSQVAKNFQLIRFTLDQKVFSCYGRYQLPYHHFLHLKTGIKVVNSKARKIKAQDLILNTQMKNSNIKYSKVQSLSLSQGQFILIQYIQQVPLIMSTIGMCQRMFIQINHQEMLEKINQDLIRDVDLYQLQNLRDNVGNKNIQAGFQKKCDLWRQNVKDHFGENGKLFLWEHKNAGKLIGSPDGLGVALMESNLATYPIVKKKTQYNSRDFLLVREGDKWFIRKIDHIYVSGQIQPKKQIFTPGSRDYNTFKNTYEKAYIRKQIISYGTVNFQMLKFTFKGQSQASLKKALKSIRATSNDNKSYLVQDGFDNIQYQLTAQDVCLYERMQKSICMLKDAGIDQMRNNQKMKNVLKEFNKKNIQNLQKFAISRMIRDQLLLTSWYLTDSFSKFRNQTSKIQIVGMADPTSGKGGYSYINKPQKQRTAREDMQQRNEKAKVSGTASDLRKLKKVGTTQFLKSRGYNQDQLSGKGRWGLVRIIRKEKDTVYARNQRQTKIQKAQNQKKQISRVFNKMLSYLNDQGNTPVFNYNFKKKITLDDLMQKQKLLWIKTKQKFKRAREGSGNQKQSSDEIQQ